MYQLLLGACRLGCEPLVHCLLSSPVMEELTHEQIKEAYECAISNGHEVLSDLLMELIVLHDMTPMAPQYISRDSGNPQAELKHVPAYYAVLDELHQGGDSPQGTITCLFLILSFIYLCCSFDFFVVARAETVLKQLLVAMKDAKEREEENQSKESKEEEKEKEEDLTRPEPEDVTTPIIEITPNLSVNELTVQMDKTTLSPRRRLSSSAKLTRQTNSISGEKFLNMTASTTLFTLLFCHCYRRRR